MNNRYIQQIAIFIISLMITIPFYVSDVYADINDVKVYNKDGVENFVSQNYDLTVEADVSLNSNVNPNKVRIKHGSGLYTTFDSCSSSNNNSLCTVSVIKGVNSEVEVCPSSNFEIELYESIPGLPIDTKSFQIKCDAQPPITNIQLSPTTSKGGIITLTYDVTDPSNSRTSCSGIEKVEIYTSFSTGAATLLTNSSSCSLSKSTTIDTSVYADGEIDIFVKAYDKIGQSSIANSSFIVDKTGPEATASVNVKDLSGSSILFFKPQTVLLDITLDITDLIGVNNYNLDYSDLTTTPPSCSDSGTNVVCTWSNVRVHMEESTLTKTIKLTASDILGNNATRDIPVQAVVTSDITPPTISLGEIIIDTVDGSELYWHRPGEMKMNFTAEITDDSSGIETISGDFSNINLISGSTPSCEGTNAAYTCTWSNVRFNIDSANFAKEIKVIAIDKAGNTQTTSKTASAQYANDPSAPALSNFQIQRSDLINLSTWIGNQEYGFKISVDISEQGSGIESVKLDLSELNPIYNTQVEGSCSQTSGSSSQETTDIYQDYIGGNSTLPKYTYTCSFSPGIIFSESGNPLAAQFKFNVTDASLNYVNPSFTQNLNIDIDGPMVTSLRTDKSFNNQYFVGKDSNNFIAIIGDTGIGMSKSNAYLDLSSIGLDNNVKAANCTTSTCYWYTDGTTIEEGEYEVSLKSSTQDDLGNYLKDSFEINVTVDTTPPIINSVNVSAVASTTAIYEEYLQTGNALYIIINITESTSLLNAVGDFSKFIIDETEDLADACERQKDDLGNTTDEWICVWATDEIDVSSYVKSNLDFNITDVAGNSEVYGYEIEVFEALAEEFDYWDNEIGDGSPSELDKEIISLSTPFIWFPIELKSTESKSATDRWPIEVELVTCTGFNLTDSEGTDTGAYLSSSNSNLPLLTNPNTDEATILPYTIYLKYVLEQTIPPEDSLDLTCQLKIKTIVDNKKLSSYEYENITVKIDYYNNPLGEIDDNIQAEIENIKSGWLVDQTWMDSVEQILNIATTICQLVQTWQHITMIWAYITSGFSNCCAIPGANAVCCPAQQGAETAKETSKLSGKTLYESYGKPLCAMINCRMWEPKWLDGEGTLANWGAWQKNSGTTNLKTGEFTQVWDVKNSLLLSILFLCLPGVIYNLQKARTIECNYISCLKSTAQGQPLQMCVKQRDYGWCKYVYGQMFNLLPWAGLINAIGANIKKALSHPLEAIGFTVDLACMGLCRTPGAGGLCGACTAFEMVDWTLDVLCDLSIGENCEGFWEELTVDEGVCEAALDDD
jgi:hypothetical protein